MAIFQMIYVPILVSTILLLLHKSEARSAALKNIVNGTIVENGQYPFMVSLQVDDEHWCAGSIINPLYILTAAHCLEDYSNPKRYSVLVGTVKLSEGGTRYNVSSVMIHEDYNDDVSLENDIGLVKLGEPLCFDEYVKPVVLPQENESTPSSSRVNVIGWGHQKYGGDLTDELRKVELIVYSDEACLALHEDSPSIHLPISSNICAGVPEGRKAECNADSGGPVFNKQHQVGIVSWSVKPCGLFPYPGVYTEVSQFIKWIKKNSGASIKESKTCS